MTGAPARSLSPIRVWLTLGRVSNLPTCLTNVAIGIALTRERPWQLDSWPLDVTLLCVGAIVALYLGGMLLNDVVDARWDREHGNDRPIATGAIARGPVLVVSIILCLVGTGLLAAQNSKAAIVATGLLLSIVGYNLLHKRFAAATLLMGLCRGLVIVSAFCAAGDRWPSLVGWLVAGAMTMYIMLLTIVARHEHRARPRVHMALVSLLVVSPIIPALAVQAWHPMLSVGASLALMVWTFGSASQLHKDPPQVGRAVQGWLAGICLVDAWSLVLIGAWPVAMIATVCWMATLVSQREISGT